MKTQSELKIDNLSYTKKDFYQIYPEALDLVNKLTDIWHPESSNESDPGNVLIKLLSAYTDKINYTIDKKLLERFPASVTEDAAMRKLCEMLVYDMHYYRSATTTASFMWVGDELNSDTDPDPSKSGNYIELPAFKTILTNDSEDIQYVLTQPVRLDKRYDIQANKTIIEGTLVELEINDDNILRSYNLDAKNRFYLPENGIAENGIYITNADDATKSWERKSNLNTVELNSRVWKFGLDSRTETPYIQFPDNILELIGNGLKIYYVRTSGASGNVNAQTLTKLLDSTVTLHKYDEEANEVEEEIELTDQLTIQNPYSTINGLDKETIDEAWENYKKTIGTFETLVTCRDYMNAIYKLVLDEHTDNTPVVSNCLVTDIRSDINLSDTVISYDDLGIRYDVEPKIRAAKNIVKGKVSSAQGIIQDSLVSFIDKDGNQVEIWFKDILNALGADDATYNVEVNETSNTAFNLVLYPLTSIKTTYSKETYQNSFKPDRSARKDIEEQINDYKTIAHKIVDPDSEDIYLIKNYYKLSAKISTTHKVNKYEANQIKNNIYSALYRNFNSRILEYGEEIPYDTLLQVMTEADATIKDIALDEPVLITKYMLGSGEEGYLTNKDEILNTLSEEQKAKSKEIYQRLVAKNVLAGRTPLFNYNENLNSFYGQSTYSADFNPYNLNNTELEEFSKVFGSEQNNYSKQTTTNENSITTIDTDLRIYPKNINDVYTLRQNEKFQLLAPKLVTKMTYPVYINYFFKKADANSGNSEAIPCCLIKIDKYFMTKINNIEGFNYINLINFDTDDTVKENAFNKTFQWLLAKGKNVYRKDLTQTSTPGYLVDKEGYAYSSILERKGTLYKSILNYNNKYENNYYTTTDLKNNTLEDSGQGAFELIQVDPENFQTVRKFTIDKTEFQQKLNIINSNYGTDITIDYIINNCVNYTYPGEASNLGQSCQINGEWINNVLRYIPVREEDSSNPGEYITTQIPIVAAYYFRVLPISLGKNEGTETAYIQKDVDYAFRPNDELYINYTDNNDNTISRKYYIDADGKPKVITYKNRVEITDYTVDEESFNGIIKPNFDLYDSLKWVQLGHSWAKNLTKVQESLPDGCTTWTNVQGMFSLASSDEIYIRDFSKTVINKPCYLYWLANNNNTLQFTKERQDGSTEYGLYSYVLQDSELLFYTDPSKSSLTTFGAGSKLILRLKMSDVEERPDKLIWSLNNNESVTKEDIALNGLGAFANNDWITKPNEIQFNSEVTLTIQQMLISTAVQGDVISHLNVADELLGDANNEYIDSSKWWKLRSDKEHILRINNEPITYLNVAEEDTSRYGFYWSLKPTLDINVGPDLSQKLSDYVDESTGNIIAENRMMLYTSYFLDADGNVISNDDIINELEYNYMNIKEEINSENALNKTPLRQISLRSNYLIQQSGGLKINVSTTNLNGVRTDNLFIYPFAELDVKAETPQHSEISLGNGITKLDFTKYSQVDLPIYVPYQHMLVFALYYHTTFKEGIKATSLKTGTEEVANYLINYKDGLEKKSEIKLQPGLNIIACKDSCIVRLSEQQANTGDSISLLNNSFVRIKDNDYGLNLKMLNLKANEVENFLTKYITIYPKFYYNAPITNERYLDVDTLDDPYSWFNTKNICSNFVISELDISSFTNIDITKNSRVN